MSNKTGSYKGHRFHGDPKRFEVVADAIADTFGRKIKYIADVAGGQGMLTKILNRKYNYESIVFDPREYVLRGVPNKIENFLPENASYYDLVVGLHPDQATHTVVKSSLHTNTLIIPCCNFWDRSRKLGRDALLEEIETFYKQNNVEYLKTLFNFEGPKNIGFFTFRNL